MAITTTTMERAFSYNGVDLPDPGSELSATDVRDLYSVTYPELANASNEGPEPRGNRLVYTFRRAVGTKG